MDRLPSVNTKEEYGRTFDSVEFWKEHVLAAAQHSGVLSTGGDATAASSVTIPFPGTFPVFFLAEKFVVKFFSKFHKGGSAWKTESCLYELFSQNEISFSPRFYGSGSLAEVYGVPELMRQLDAKEDQTSMNTIPATDWPWPFIIAERMQGNSLKEVRTTKASNEEEEEEIFEQVAQQLGEVLNQLHKIHVTEKTALRLPNLRTTYFKDFLERQLRNYPINHKKWGMLPPHLFSQLADFLPSSSDVILSNEEPLVFMHCDLHEDHIFMSLADERGDGNEGEKKKKNSIKVRGVIDFNDCTLGLKLYELIQIHMNSFRCNKKVLRVLLQSLGWEEELKNTTRFAYRCMCLTLLHEYDMFNTVEEGYMIELDKIESLSQLATLMWDISVIDDSLPIHLCDIQSTKPAESSLLQH